MLGTQVFSTGYRYVLKPLLFSLDAEVVHDGFTTIGERLGKQAYARAMTSSLLRYEHSMLEQTVLDREFDNPVGLSAGFDYDGRLTEVLGPVGFGFASIGTVTNQPYEGNPSPRLGRLPESKGLLVNKGFKSEGMDAVLERLVIPEDLQVGLSIGATNSEETSTPAAQIEDIVRGFEKALAWEQAERLAYFELNISCPNVRGSGSLAELGPLAEVLGRLQEIALPRPLLIKFPIEIAWGEAEKLLSLMVSHGVAGVIIGNLLKNRTSGYVDSAEMQQISEKKGNISGKPTEKLSNDLIYRAFESFGEDLVIVGVGGIFSAEDAYEKILRGAQLVELITGMVYRGPQLIGEINRGLVSLLKRDGFLHISEAVGAKHR